MRALIRDSSGNITLAMLLVVFGTVSALALCILALSDTYFTGLDCDLEQVFHFLRSEANRSVIVLDNYDAMHEGFYLPEKIAVLTDSRQNNTYCMQSRLIPTDNANTGFRHAINVFDIHSLVEVNNNSLSPSTTNWVLPGARGYSRKTIRKGSGLLDYIYFTDTDFTTNDTPNYYWGPDVLYGKVHSNSDVWIKQGGGGNNNGWPTFFGPVFTAGQIQSFSGTPPYAQVFRAGYWEHSTPLVFNATAIQIRAHGTTIGPSAYDPNRIIFVNVTGGSYNTWVGQVINAGPDTADVWTQYPPRAGTYLMRNRWTRYDTIWTSGPIGACYGHSNIVYSKMWFKGMIQGAQTWCAVDTLYLNDNCFLAGTVMGGCPDGSIGGSSTNRSDYLGIVSEKSIIIQYGYKDPQDSVRYKPNCDGDQNGIWIYAALCALGDGAGNSHYDGVFSFEYQHPHPSVPAVFLNNVIWANIDLHRRKYPPTPSQAWPGNIDLPWYNSLWPEGSPYCERGTIHLWGSVAQRRSGYVHRNTTDSEYPNPGQIWNIPIDYCGGSSCNSIYDSVLETDFSCMNAPGTTGSEVGYKRDFRYDNRLQYISPPDFPSIRLSGSGPFYNIQSWSFQKAPRNLTVLN